MFETVMVYALLQRPVFLAFAQNRQVPLGMVPMRDREGFDQGVEPLLAVEPPGRQQELATDGNDPVW